MWPWAMHDSSEPQFHCLFSGSFSAASLYLTENPFEILIYKKFVLFGKKELQEFRSYF